MKKLFALIFCVVLAIPFCGCESKKQEKQEKLNIVTTVFPAYDFARQVTGNSADVTMILPCGGETHSYEASLTDIKKISECDIFIYVGGSIDGWAESVLKGTENKNRTVIKLLDVFGIKGEEHSEEHHQEEADEHIWTSLKNAQRIVEKISNAVQNKDKSNAYYYSKNTENYLNKLNNLDKDFKNAVDNSSKNILAFADRFPFYYFVNDYGLNYVSALDGCSSDTEPTFTAVGECVKAVKENNLKYVLFLEFSNKTAADKICKETGVNALQFNSCHSISKEEFNNGKTYLDLMQENLSTLKEVLN